MLLKRIISSVFLLSLLFSSIFMGYPYFNIFFGVILAVMAWEWDNFINKKSTMFGIMYASLAIFCLTLPLIMDLKLRIPLFAILIVATSIYFVAKNKKYNNPMLLAFGAIYIALPALAINIISTANSIQGIIWLLAIAWACDIGGYIFGCSLKGPKLCPKISPNKTWAGFIGGLVLACAFSYGYTSLQSLEWQNLYILTIALGIVAQIGDLLESSIKRYIGIKDTSCIIPGHGGVFDRLDSTILVLVIYAILVIASDSGLIDMKIF